MKQEERVLKALGNVKDAYILESGKYMGNPQNARLIQAKKQLWKPLQAAVAVLVVLLSGLLVWKGELAPGLHGQESTSFIYALDDSRELKMVAETASFRGDVREIRQVLIYEEENLLQTFDKSAIVNSTAYRNGGLFLCMGSPIGEPDFRDVNFDGYTDIGLMAVSNYPHYVLYNYFLWNPATQRYEYGFTLFGSEALEVNGETRRLTEHTLDEKGIDTTTSYWVIDGRLVQFGIADLDEDILVMEDSNPIVYRPSTTSPDLPLCELEVQYLPGILPRAAALKQADALGYPIMERYWLEAKGAFVLSAIGGKAWDSPMVESWFIPCGAGSIQLTALYFSEAAEGYGMTFNRMMNDFWYYRSGGFSAAEEAILEFADCYFAKDSEAMASYLVTNGGETYPQDGSDVRVVRLQGMDKLEDHIAQSGSGRVSLVFREKPDADSYSYLTMEVVKDGDSYKIRSYELEK